ncbi:unnamed protein product, partial [Cuscuta campestris]
MGSSSRNLYAGIGE